MKNVNCDDFDFIFLLHSARGNHWALIVTDQRKRPAISIDYVDFLYKDGSDRENVLDIVKQWHQSRTKLCNVMYFIAKNEIF